MSNAFTKPVEQVKFNCKNEKCGNYRTYDNCRQCSRNKGLEGRRAYADRFEG